MLTYAAVCCRMLTYAAHKLATSLATSAFSPTAADESSHIFVFFSKALSEDLMKMERLESLALWRCDMTADTMRDIAPGLSHTS